MPNPTTLLISNSRNIQWNSSLNKHLLVGSTEHADYVPFIICESYYRLEKNGNYYYFLDFPNNLAEERIINKPATFRQLFYFGRDTNTVIFTGDDVEYYVSNGIIYTMIDLEVKILAVVAVEKHIAVNAITNRISMNPIVLLVDSACFSDPKLKKMSYYLTKQFFLDAEHSQIDTIITTNILEKVFKHINIVSEEPTLDLLERKLNKYKSIIAPYAVKRDEVIEKEQSVAFTGKILENVLVWEQNDDGTFTLIDSDGTRSVYSSEERDSIVDLLTLDSEENVNEFRRLWEQQVIEGTGITSTTEAPRHYVAGFDPYNEDSHIHVTDSSSVTANYEEAEPFPNLEQVTEELQSELEIIGTAGEMTEEEINFIDEIMNTADSTDSVTFEEVFEEDENVEIVSENYRTYFTTEDGEEVFIIETPQVNERLSETPQIVRQEESPARNAHEIINRMEEELQISEEDLIDDGSEA